MEQNRNEQIDERSHPAEADSILGEQKSEISLEKFKDVTSLLKAYNSLEAEFTKRSQRIKQLEREYEALQKSVETKPETTNSDPSAKIEGEYAENVARDFYEKYPEAKAYSSYLEEVADFKSADGLKSAYIDLLTKRLRDAEKVKREGFDLSQVDSATKDEIIKAFLSEILSAKPKTKALNEGEIILTPPIRPKSLQEAGLLAEKYFK